MNEISKLVKYRFYFERFSAVSPAELKYCHVALARAACTAILASGAAAALLFEHSHFPFTQRWGTLLSHCASRVFFILFACMQKQKHTHTKKICSAPRSEKNIWKRVSGMETHTVGKAFRERRVFHLRVNEFFIHQHLGFVLLRC